MRTGAPHPVLGMALVAATKRSALSTASARNSAAGRSEPDSMSAARASLLGYMGVSMPVRAQSSRFMSAAALLAMWLRTWRRVQPGRRDASSRSLSLNPATWATKNSVPARIQPRRVTSSSSSALASLMSRRRCCVALPLPRYG